VFPARGRSSPPIQQTERRAINADLPARETSTDAGVSEWRFGAHSDGARPTAIVVKSLRISLVW
jgi:hypothetical protein